MDQFCWCGWCFILSFSQLKCLIPTGIETHQTPKGERISSRFSNFVGTGRQDPAPQKRPSVLPAESGVCSWVLRLVLKIGCPCLCCHWATGPCPCGVWKGRAQEVCRRNLCPKAPALTLVLEPMPKAYFHKVSENMQCGWWIVLIACLLVHHFLRKYTISFILLEQIVKAKRTICQ
jgi:hypothetical protein